MKILLVEDDPQLASFIKKGFEHEDYELMVAYDGRSGWSLYQQQPYDMVVLDVNLPYLNGVELCQRNRPDDPRILPARAPAEPGTHHFPRGYRRARLGAGLRHHYQHH